uniref:UTP--glucose-1-phosphate uridylyltransferase n=1 Tax=Romanomermis culicivorax TaxID=13658 RepID=A0A915K9V3_ROMCU
MTRQQSEHWKDATSRESLESLNYELNKLLQTSTPQESPYWEREFRGFRRLFKRFLTSKPTIAWDKIHTLPEGAIKNYANLTKPEDSMIKELLNKLIVVKLNGGLGTSMGCKGPKSVIPVRILMNSFNTDDDTKKVLRKYKNVRVNVHTFTQSRYPRINKETLLPLTHNLNSINNEYWYPPGHGDFYESFHHSGLLKKFIEQGRNYCFISNIDNLGALVDMNILNFMHESGSEFIMEVTDKTRADVKGGTLILHEDRLTLLEIAQVSKDHEDEFKSVSKFRIFNTNNLWCNLSSVANLVDSDMMEMEIIVNPKHLEEGIEIVQLETAVGAAIKNFKGAVGVNVPRFRFLPVKKTQDLLMVMSNLYEMENGTLTLSSKRNFPSLPLIKLGSQFDKGTVIIIANHGDRIDVPPGAVFENKIVSGNLRILDH